MAALPVLVTVSQAAQARGCGHRPQLEHEGPRAISMESVSDSLVTNMHMCSPLEVVSSGSDSVPPAPSHTKEQMPNVLLG